MCPFCVCHWIICSFIHRKLWQKKRSHNDFERTMWWVQGAFNRFIWLRMSSSHRAYTWQQTLTQTDIRKWTLSLLFFPTFIFMYLSFVRSFICKIVMACCASTSMYDADEWMDGTKCKNYYYFLLWPRHQFHRTNLQRWICFFFLLLSIKRTSGMAPWMVFACNQWKPQNLNSNKFTIDAWRHREWMKGKKYVTVNRKWIGNQEKAVPCLHFECSKRAWRRKTSRKKNHHHHRQ